MDYRKTVSKIKSLKEAAPTNNTSGVENFDKFLFPGNTDLLTQDWQTPYQLKWGLTDVVPVKHLTLADIDTMTTASTEYVNKMNEETPKRSLNAPLENIMNIVRGLNEEMMGGAPTNNVSGGNIAGAVSGETPPVFNKKKKRKPTPVGRYGSRRMWLQNGKS